MQLIAEKLKNMNKTRILGIIMLIIGISLFYTFDNDGIDFIFGILFGAGLLLTITGRFSYKSKA